MKIVLISCYDRGCLGNRILSSVLKNAGHKVYLIYFKEHQNRLKTKQDSKNAVTKHEGVNSFGADTIFCYGKPITKYEIQLLISLLKNINPSLIGFSLSSISIDLVNDIMGDIKQQIKVPIIWGGIGPTLEPERCLQYADIVCLGEGEYAILELANKLNKGEDISTINNLWIKVGNHIVRNPIRSLIQNLDKLPFPDCLPDNKFTIENNCIIENEKRIFNYDKLFYEIMTSRGCYFTCSYCCNALYRKFYDGQKYVRRRSVDNVLKELEEAKKNIPLLTICFRDEIFTYDEKWIEEFSYEYPRRIGLRFWCNTHPMYVKKKNLELLKKSGMFYITMGIESGSENVLYKIFNRKTPLKSIIEASQILKALNLKNDIRYDLIVNNPLENDEDRRETLHTLCNMPRPLNIGLSKLSFFPRYEINKLLSVDTNTKDINYKTYKFWNYLYLLTQYQFFPKTLILRFSQNHFFKKHPWILKQLLLPRRIKYIYEESRQRLGRLIPGNMKKIIKRILGKDRK